MDATAVQKLEDLILVNVPPHLLDTEAVVLRRAVLRSIRLHTSRWVLLDFSQVEICDSFFGRFVQSMAETTRLMGARVIVSGLQDSVVETMVGLGFELPGIMTVLDVDEALCESRRIREAELGADGLEENLSPEEPGESTVPAGGAQRL